MAISTCPKCESTSFEISPLTVIKGLEFKMHFIQCSHCGAVVGVQEQNDLDYLLNLVADKLGISRV